MSRRLLLGEGFWTAAGSWVPFSSQLLHGQVCLSASAAILLKFSCMRVGRASMYCKTIRTLCLLVAPFGAHAPAANSTSASTAPAQYPCKKRSFFELEI